MQEDEEGSRRTWRNAGGHGGMQGDEEVSGAEDEAGLGTAPSPTTEAASHHGGGPCFPPDILMANENIFAICIN